MPVENFKSVIGIHGVPRSGTSWLAQIFNSDPRIRMKFQPLFSYALKDRIRVDSSYQEILSFYLDMWKNNEDEFLNMRDPEIHKSYPVFQKKSEDILMFKQVHHHYVLPRLMELDNELKIILVLRNPLAVLSSWKKAPREFKPNWIFLKEWRYAALKNQDKSENYFGFEKWKEATLLFLKLKEDYTKRVFIVEYQSLLDDTDFQVRLLYDFIGVRSLDSQTLSFIEASRRKNDQDPNSVYKSKQKDDGWMNNLPNDIINEVSEDELFVKLNERYNWK